MTQLLAGIEKIIYNMKLSLVISYLAASAVMLAYIYTICKESVHTITEMLGDHANAESSILGVLSVIDGIMVANVVYLIVAGSYEIYVKDHASEAREGIPNALQHLSSGLLKEKMASSLFGVSSVYVLKQLIEQDITVLMFAVVAVFHLLLIIGFYVLNRTNNNDIDHGHSSILAAIRPDHDGDKDDNDGDNTGDKAAH